RAVTLAAVTSPRTCREDTKVTSLNELELAHLPIESPELALDPMPYFEAARGKHPWLAKSNVGFIVTEYTAMKEILSQGRQASDVEPGDRRPHGRAGDGLGPVHRRDDAVEIRRRTRSPARQRGRRLHAS